MCSLGQRPNALVWASAAHMAVHSVPCSGCAMAAQLEPLCCDQQLKFCAPKTCCNLQPALLEFSLDGTSAAEVSKRAPTWDAPHGRIKAGRRVRLSSHESLHTRAAPVQGRHQQVWQLLLCWGGAHAHHTLHLWGRTARAAHHKTLAMTKFRRDIHGHDLVHP